MVYLEFTQYMVKKMKFYRPDGVKDVFKEVKKIRLWNKDTGMP